MSLAVLGTTFVLSVLGTAIAIVSAKRSQFSFWSSWAASLTHAVVAMLALWLMTGSMPPQFFAATLPASAEPWQLLIWPLLGAAALWPLAIHGLGTDSPKQLAVSLGLASFVFWAALPSGESYADIVPGNAAWTLFALFAAVANWVALKELDQSGAGRWWLWIMVAFVMLATAICMSCYASLGEYCLSLAICLMIMATGRSAVSQGEWQIHVAWVGLVLICGVLSHVRIYSALALPPWLAPLPFLLPTWVALLDAALVRKRSSLLRVVTAAAVSVLLAGITIAILLAGSSSGEDW